MGWNLKLFWLDNHIGKCHYSKLLGCRVQAPDKTDESPHDDDP
ncbi:Uncharacterised protein [Yersinia enterocolitica]|nr:Uncharacterised protein [Yersinia enterocolitica]